MSEPTCEQVRLLLSLGEPGNDRHLRECASCRNEAERLASIFRALGSQPAVEVPARLDNRIRARLAGNPPLAESRVLTPAMILLSAAATLAVIAGYMIILLNMHPPSPALSRGLVLVVAYVAISSVATLPLLLHRTRPRREVRPWT